MIAVDSSVFIDYFEQSQTPEAAYLDALMGTGEVVLPPVVLTELLSVPRQQPEAYRMLAKFVLLESDAGYWYRAGDLRQKVRRAGNKAALGDALIAQSCIDHGVPLLTRDVDFKHYAKHGGLKLVKVRGK